MQSFHGLYEDTRLLRSNGAFRVLSARARSQARRVTLVVAEGREGAAERAALERLAQAHAAIEHPMVARTSAVLEAEGRTIVELACPAIADSLEVEACLVATNTLVPYALGDGFVRDLRIGMEAAHRARDEQGRPLCLGRLSPANILFDAEGRSYLLGFGHNVAVAGPSGRPIPAVPYTQAPEIAIGAHPTPEADYVAVLLFARLLSRHTDTRGELQAVMKAITMHPGDTIVEVLRLIEARFIGAPPGLRGTIDEGIAAADRLRALLGVTPDPQGFARLAAGLLAGRRAQASVAGGDVLVLAPEAASLRVGEGPPIELRGPARRIILALADHLTLGAGTLLKATELAGVGWPEESAQHEAMMNRVYVTLARIRKRLPEGVLERFDDGYRFAPRYSLLRSEPPR